MNEKMAIKLLEEALSDEAVFFMACSHYQRLVRNSKWDEAERLLDEITMDQLKLAHGHYEQLLSLVSKSVDSPAEICALLLDPIEKACSRYRERAEEAKQLGRKTLSEWFTVLSHAKKSQLERLKRLSQPGKNEA